MSIQAGVLKAADPHRTPARVAAALSVVVFSISLGADFVYDDLARIVQDDRIRHLSSIGKLLTGEYNGDGQDNLYRPLVSLTYAIQYWLHGTLGWPYHLVNVLLHGWVTYLVAILAGRLAPMEVGRRAAWIAGVIFAVHPIHAEAVIAIVGRAESMCALGYLGAILLLLPVARGQSALSTRRATACAGCAVVALLSKEQGMVLPLILLLMWLLGRQARPVSTATLDRSSGVGTGRGVIDYAHPNAKRPGLAPGWAILILGICGSVALYIVAREQWLGLRLWWDRSFLDWSIQPLIRAEGVHRWLIPTEIMGRYVELLLFPRVLAMDYGAAVIMPKTTPGSAHLWIGALTIATYAAVTVVAAVRRSWCHLWLLLAFGVCYGVISNFVTIIGTTMGERLMYLPTVFLFSVIGLWLAGLKQRRWHLPLLVILAAVWGLRCIDYGRHWMDARGYYEYQLQTQPKSMRVLLAAGLSAMEAGELDRAAEIAAQARATLPDYWDAWVMSGKIALQQQRYDDAVRFMQEAFRLWPSVYTQRQLGEAQAARNRAELNSTAPEKGH